jgi:hypothetical protein
MGKVCAFFSLSIFGFKIFIFFWFIMSTLALSSKEYSRRWILPGTCNLQSHGVVGITSLAGLYSFLDLLLLLLLLWLFFYSFVFYVAFKICPPWPSVDHQSIVKICFVDEPAFIASLSQRITTSPLAPEDRLALEESRVNQRREKKVCWRYLTPLERTEYRSARTQRKQRHVPHHR